jgi:hypothetical protein
MTPADMDEIADLIALTLNDYDGHHETIRNRVADWL